MYENNTSMNKHHNKSHFNLVVEIIILIFFFLASVYAYEFANYLAFIIFGLAPKISWLWVLPTGVATTGSCGVCATFLKPLQVAISIALTFMSYLALRKINLAAARYGFIGIISLNLASFYWESFSSLGPVPMFVHEILFVGLTLVTTLAITTVIHLKR